MYGFRRDGRGGKTLLMLDGGGFGGVIHHAYTIFMKHMDGQTVTDYGFHRH